MKLFDSPSSPFVRKCLVVAHEYGLVDRIERVPAAPSVVNRVPELEAANPLGKVPALQNDDGSWLFDSPVICEYLDSLGGGSMLPAQGSARWRVLTVQA
ncbi:MAG: glutathione S-transferase N-terminal domain-containing protein, partial [Burkholderiaceae bacterium]